MKIIGTIILNAEDLVPLGEKKSTTIYRYNEMLQIDEVDEVINYTVTLDGIAWGWLYGGQNENATPHQKEMWRKRINAYGLFYGRTSIYEEGPKTYLKVEEAMDEDSYGNPTYWEIVINYN